MTSEAAPRRLSAIVVGDVAGYSRLTSLDEAGTLERLLEIQTRTVNPLIERYNGRVVKFMGDGFLAEFASAIDSVMFSIQLQDQLLTRNADVPDDTRISFRVGVHLDDIVSVDDDILGEGVNIAARLQQIAEPDDICVSGAVFDRVADRVDAQFDDIGAQRLKNIPRPVHAYIRRSRPANPTSKLGKLPFLDLPAEKPALFSGGCLCGHVRYEVTEPDLGSLYCHCSMCRRFTGGAVASGVTVLSEAVRWVAATPKYYRSSNIAERGFCPDCGSALVFRTLVGEWSKWLLLFTGSLDNPSEHPPLYHMGMESAVDWLDIRDDLRRITCFDSPTLRAAYESVGERIPGLEEDRS